MVLAEAFWIITVFKTDVNLGKGQLTRPEWAILEKGQWFQQARLFPDLGDPENRVLLQVPVCPQLIEISNFLECGGFLGTLLAFGWPYC